MLEKKVSTNSRNTVAVAVRDHPYITSAKGLGGWVGSKNGHFNADAVFI